jgi:hypothetical protein
MNTPAIFLRLRRTLFRSRVWRPTLVRAGLLGTITALGSVDNGDRYRATWTTESIIQKSTIVWHVADMSDGHLAISRDL